MLHLLSAVKGVFSILEANTDVRSRANIIDIHSVAGMSQYLFWITLYMNDIEYRGLNDTSNKTR